MLSVRCLSCLSVCPSMMLVYCGQRVGWIKMKHVTWYGGRPRPRRHCVRWGPISPKKGNSSPTLFGQCVVAQRLDGHCVTWRPSSPPQKKRGTDPQFSAYVCCGQTPGLIKMSLGTEVVIGPGDIVLDGDPASPKKGDSLHFSADVYCGHNGWMDQDATWHEGRRRARRHCVRWRPNSSPKRGTPPPNFRPMPIVVKLSPISASAEHLLNR